MIGFLRPRPRLTPGLPVAVFSPAAVKENIAYGIPEGSYSMDDVYEAAKNANIHRYLQ